MEHLRQAAGRDRQPKALAEHGHDFVERDAELRVHQHDERNGARAQVHVRGSQCVGGLQRMPPLHPSPTVAATAHLDIEVPDHRANDREILLILGGDAGALDGAAAVRARGGQRGRVALIDASRRGPSPAAAIRGPGAPAWTSAATLGPVLRKRRRLAEASAPGGIELVLETFVLALQSIAFALDLASPLFRARHVLAQPRDLLAFTFDQLVAIITGRALIRHACVMPYPQNLYKYKLLDSFAFAQAHALNEDLEHCLDAARPRRPWMRLGDLAAASNQMRKAGLMRRAIELPIRRPAVAHEDATDLGAKHRRRFVKPAPVLNGVDDDARGRKDPQPPEPPPDFPTRFIRTDDRTAADLIAQCRIGWRRVARGPMERVGHATGPHAQPEPVAQQRRDLAVREAEVCVEQHDQRDGVRPQMRARGAERVSRLQRVAALHPPATAAAAPDMHVELTHMRPHHGEIFLNLGRYARFDQPPPQEGHASGSGTSMRSSIVAGGRRCACRPCRRPARRPGRRGCGVGAPFENGAA